METMENLRERLEALENQALAFAHQTRAAERQLRWWRILACSSVVLGVVILPLVGGTAQEQSSYERAMARRLAALEYKLQYFSGGPNEVVISGANLRIVNGLGRTDTTNGLGNLIVGYNESRQEAPDCSRPSPFCIDTRTGSHNLVVGRFNRFSSFGGLVVGELNEISGEFASVSGGRINTASGIESSVSGGVFNTASGEWASVTGGGVNTASGDSGASVSGGAQNTASGEFASVSGGLQRTAPAENNWAAGPLSAVQ
jgi:hypothetical protein